MNLDMLRLELMAEHERLRDRLGQMRRLARSIEKGHRVEEAERDLRMAILKLRDELEAHCAHETEALGPILRTLDAWGPERQKVMEREHLAEHQVLGSVLQQAHGASGPARLAAATRTLVRELLEHMEEEEKHLLNPRVLTDEFINPAQLTD